MRRQIVLTTLAAITLGACAEGAPVAEVPPEPVGGRLVIVGGALDADNAEVYRAIVEAREGDGPICVLPTASGVPQRSMESAVATIGGYAGDGTTVGLFLAEENAERAYDETFAAELEACSAYFFTGGSQSRVVDAFLPSGDTTPAFRALHRRWEEGAVVAGSSAGAAMMSGVMIASGQSAGALAHGIASAEDGEGVSIRRGLAFFERAILDQHFLARGRIGRLLVAALATDSLPVGLGIDENTALVVDGDRAHVVGASGVVVVDARGAVPEQGRYGTGLRVSLAGAGDRIDLGTLEVVRGEGKTPLTADDRSFEAPADPFERWVFLHLLSDLAASSGQEATFAVPGATLTVREGESFTAARAPGEGVQGEPAGLSAGPFIVDLVGTGSSATH